MLEYPYFHLFFSEALYCLSLKNIQGGLQQFKIQKTVWSYTETVKNQMELQKEVNLDGILGKKGFNW